MYNKFVKLFSSFLLIFSIIICSNVTYIKAATENNDDFIKAIEDTLEVNIVKDSIISLHDKNNDIVAYFYQLTPIGYIIIDSKTNGVIEYCVSENSEYITDQNKVYFYSGPLSYYEASSLSDKQIYDCKRHTKISKNKINFESKTFFKYDTSNDENLNSSESSNSVSATSSSLPYLTKPYDTNNGNICGATASAILLEYYYSHIDSSVVLPANITSDGEILTNLLVSYVPGGANVIVLDSGLDLYLDSVRSSKTASHVTIANIITSPTTRMELCIAASKPCIIGLTEEPTYGEHWAVATGYQKNVEFVNINDGWGHRGILVSYVYVDSCVYLK